MKYIQTLALFALLALGSQTALAQTPAPETTPKNTEQNSNFSKEKLTEAYKAQNWEETLRQANELLKLEPQNADIFSLQGVAYANLSQNENALKAFEQALKLRPDDTQIKVSICGVKHNLKHPQAAETCLEAAKIAPNNPELQYLTGTMLEEQKKYQEARTLFEAAYKLVPDSAVYLTAITSLDFKLGDNQKALERGEKAVQGHFAKNPIIWLNLLTACNRSSAYEKTIDYANKAYDSFHDHYILAERAEAYLALGKFDEAQKDLDAIIDKFTVEVPGSAKTRYLYAKSLLASSCSTEKHQTCTTDQKDSCCGRAEQALTILKTLSNDKKFKDNTLPVYLGHAHILNGELEAAEALLTKATQQQIDKDNASALASLAVALYQFKDARDKTAALRFYQQAVDASPDFADPQKIRSTRAWAPRIIETLTQIQNDAKSQAEASHKKSGCSCDLSSKNHSFPAAAALMALFSALGLGAIRRKA